MHQSSFRMKPCVNKELRTQQRLIVIYDDWLAQTSSDIMKKITSPMRLTFAQNLSFLAFCLSFSKQTLFKVLLNWYFIAKNMKVCG